MLRIYLIKNKNKYWQTWKLVLQYLYDVSIYAKLVLDMTVNYQSNKFYQVMLQIYLIKNKNKYWQTWKSML